MTPSPPPRATAALLGLALLPLALPASAYHVPDAAVLATHAYAGPGWVAYRLHVVGAASMQVDVALEEGGTAVGSGFVLNDASGRMVLAGAGVAGGPYRLRVASDLLGVHAQQASAGGVETRMEMEFSCSPACFEGEYVLVLYAAGAQSATSTVRMDGATVLASSSGAGAFLHRHDAFAGPALAHADLGDGRAYAGVLATKTVHVSGRLVGAFLDFQPTPSFMDADTPEGRRTCECWLAGSAPGAYAFRYATAGNGGGLWLLGADVTMPA